MKLLLEATVADRSDALGDGLVRVHVTDADSGRVAGRLSVTVELWEWVKLWAEEARRAGWAIEIRERGHDPVKVAAPATMRGRLLAAASERVAQDRPPERQDALGDQAGKGLDQPERKGRVGALWKQVQERKKGK